MWVVSRFIQGKRKRSFFDTKDAADAEAERIRGEIGTAGSTWLNLPAPERQALMMAYDESRKRGIDLYAVLATARVKASHGRSPALSAVIAELIQAKESAGRSDDYTSTLKTILNQFAVGLGAFPIASITLTNLETFLGSKLLASRQTLRARLSTLFKFAVRRGYISENPCQRLESITVAKSPPQIFDLAQIAVSLTWLSKYSPHVLPWFVLSTLCGLRPEEAEKTTARDINFVEGWVKIEAQTTKVRQRRIVYPKAEAMDLLKKSMRKGRLPIHPLARRRAIRKLREALGFDAWPKDITRHTAASYWIADCGSVERVADSLGNSENVLRRDYKALVTAKEAKAFWKIIARKAA